MNWENHAASRMMKAIVDAEKSAYDLVDMRCCMSIDRLVDVRKSLASARLTIEAAAIAADVEINLTPDPEPIDEYEGFQDVEINLDGQAFHIHAAPETTEALAAFISDLKRRLDEAEKRSRTVFEFTGPVTFAGDDYVSAAEWSKSKLETESIDLKTDRADEFLAGDGPSTPIEDVGPGCIDLTVALDALRGARLDLSLKRQNGIIDPDIVRRIQMQILIAETQIEAERMQRRVA